MSRGKIVLGTCPRCFTEQPLIWDGTVRPHGDPQNLILDCGGSLHAPTGPELPAVERLQAVTVEPGDTIVATVRAHWSMENLHRLRDALAEQFPGCRIAIATDGVELSVVRPTDEVER